MSGSSSLLAGVRARLLHASLDRRLTEAADPAGAPALALRATRITATRYRNGLSVGFERLLEAAEEPPTGLCASAPLHCAAIKSARHSLLVLAGELRSENPVRARGVALAERLLTDPAGPLYNCASAHEIEAAARAATEAL